MNLTRLIFREIAHRRTNALLALLSVTAAVACLTAGLTLLRGHDLATDRILAAKQEETEARTKQLTDDYRKIVLELGFNVFIVPKGSSPVATGPQPEMPYEYVTMLSKADIITIDHLLPSLTVPLYWQEQKMQVTLTGIHGEVAIAGGKRKRPLVQPVKPGEIVLGFKVAQSTKLKPGDKAALLGETFTISETHPFRGTPDDYTLWIDLAQAQKLLNREGVITAIQAINCLAPNCHPDATGIPSVTQEIAKVLPDTQVIIDMGKARTRIDARVRAAKEAEAALTAEKEQRAAVRGQMENFASILIPTVMVGCGLWIALLALANARERRGEIGILRALGVGKAGVLTLFLGKAVLIGLIGAGAGYALGFLGGAAFGEASAGELIEPRTAVIVLIAAPLLATLASWLPSLVAAGQDPAVVLSEE
ncbi:MAG: FtsX-like permease family protein [Phycisphaeraceae bacterium]